MQHVEDAYKQLQRLRFFRQLLTMLVVVTEFLKSRESNVSPHKNKIKLHSKIQKYISHLRGITRPFLTWLPPIG